MGHAETKKRILNALYIAKQNKKWHKVDQLKHLLKQLRQMKYDN